MLVIKFLPYYGKKIETYCKENKIEKLEDIPKDLLQSSRKDYAENYHQIIQEAHIKNTPWVNPDTFRTIQKLENGLIILWILKLSNKAIPIIKNTKPFEQVPFQWSVHKLE